MKKVLIVVMSLNLGGIETFLMNVFKYINKDKYKIDFLLWEQKETYYEDFVKNHGSNIYKIEITHNPYKDIKRIKRFLKTHKYDVIHINSHFYSAFFVYAAHICKIKKIITHVHSTSDNRVDNIKRSFFKFVSRYLILRYSTDLFACSDEAALYVFGKKTKKYTVINNGIEVDKFLIPNHEIINKIREKYSINDKMIILGNVGHLSIEKNQEYLFHILKKLLKINDNYKLMLVGDGARKQELIELSKSMNIQDNIIFVGQVQNVNDYINIFNLFLFPSLYEGFGISLVEAQAAGVNCISSNAVPKTTDMGLNLVKYLPITTHNIDKWVQCILNYKKNNISKEEIKKAFAKKDFDISNSIKNIEKVYGDVDE